MMCVTATHFSMPTPCADPESFVRGRPTFDNVSFFYFLVDEGRAIQLTYSTG